MSGILAIESSGSESFVAIYNSVTGQIVEQKGQSNDKHSEELGALLQSVLKETSLIAKDITDIVIGVGPGSFTGLRIGMSFAKGLSYALKIPIYGISSLLVAAYGASPGALYRGALVDARRDEFFSALYKVDTKIETIIPPAIRSKEDFLTEVQGAVKDPSDVVIPSSNSNIGVALIALFKAHKELFVESDSSPASLAQLDIDYIRPVAALTIAERKGIRVGRACPP